LLKGNPLDEQLGQRIEPGEYKITETSKTRPCGSGLSVKINGCDEWIDSELEDALKKFKTAGSGEIDNLIKTTYQQLGMSPTSLN